MVFLDSTVVNVALPRMGEDLPTRVLGVLEGQAYVYSAYLLSLSSLLILAGALNDHFGRRRMFAAGLVGFALASALCGLAPTMEALVLFRILQGAAGALLVPGSLALITVTFEGEERGRAFGQWAGASALTTILGPVVGGILVDVVSWRAVFLINVPLAAVALWATLSHVRESRDAGASPRFDWLGAGAVALAVGGISFGAMYGQQREWQAPMAFVALAAGTVAALAFPFLMLHSRNPLVPPHLFASRNFTVTNVSTLLIYGALYVVFYYLPLFAQGVLGYTAAGAGLLLVPLSLFLVLLSSRFGALAGRHGPRWFMAGGPVLMAAGLLWLGQVPVNSAAWAFSLDQPASYLPPADFLLHVLPGLVVFGLGLAVMVAPLTTALMTSVPERHSGVASAVNNAISRVGPQLAGALIFIAVTASFYAGLAQQAPSVEMSPELRRQVAPLNPPDQAAPPAVASAAPRASRDAFGLAMGISATLLLAGAAVNAAGIRNQQALRRAAGEDGAPAREVATV